jgi:hypothetical protein
MIGAIKTHESKIADVKLMFIVRLTGKLFSERRLSPKQ